MIKDNPARNVANIFSELIYQGNPLGRNIIGSKKTVVSFKRKDFLKYLKKFYLANDTTICVAGKFNEKKVVRQVEKYFAGMRRDKKPQYVKVVEKQKKPAVKTKKKKTDQTHFILGNRTYHENHKDRFALGLLATILGGNMSSRLFVEVREKKGLAYYVQTHLNAFADCGYLATQAGVEHKNLELTVQTIVDEYKKIATEKINANELQKAKDYIKGLSIMGLESSDEVAMFFAEQALKKKKILTPKEIFARIDAVTAGDILRVAKDIFQEKTLNLAVIGPQKNPQKLAKLLKL